MRHEIYSNIAGEMKLVLLPLFHGEQQVRAALIVALGLAPVAGLTRLALAGGAHVDVTKAWMQKHAPQAGRHYFVQERGEDGAAFAQLASSFEKDFVVSEPEAGQQQFVQLGGHPLVVEGVAPPVNIGIAGPSAIAEALAAEIELLNAKVQSQGVYIARLEDALLKKDHEAAAAREASEATKQTQTAPPSTEPASSDQTSTEPSAADLDQVSAEQTAAAATAGEEEKSSDEPEATQEPQS